MKSIIQYLRQYVTEHFNVKLYLSIAIFLTICIAFNYHYDFEDGVIDSYFGKPIQLLYFFLFQATPYYAVCLLIYCFTPKKEFVSQRGFWLYSLTGLFVLAVDRSFSFHHSLIPILPRQLTVFVLRCMSNLSTFLVVVMPLYLFHRFMDREGESLYGITKKNVNLKSYFILLLLVLLSLLTFRDNTRCTNVPMEWSLPIIYSCQNGYS